MILSILGMFRRGWQLLARWGWGSLSEVGGRVTSWNGLCNTKGNPPIWKCNAKKEAIEIIFVSICDLESSEIAVKPCLGLGHIHIPPVIWILREWSPHNHSIVPSYTQACHSLGLSHMPWWLCSETPELSERPFSLCIVFRTLLNVAYQSWVSSHGT